MFGEPADMPTAERREPPSARRPRGVQLSVRGRHATYAHGSERRRGDPDCGADDLGPSPDDDSAKLERPDLAIHEKYWRPGSCGRIQPAEHENMFAVVACPPLPEGRGSASRKRCPGPAAAPWALGPGGFRHPPPSRIGTTP